MSNVTADAALYEGTAFARIPTKQNLELYLIGWDEACRRMEDGDQIPMNNPYLEGSWEWTGFMDSEEANT